MNRYETKKCKQQYKVNAQANNQNSSPSLQIERTCALAALTQSAVLVHRCANAEACHPNFTRAMMDGFVTTDPENAGDVYGPVENLLLGIKSAEAMFSKPDASLVQVLKYIVDLTTLENRLHDRPDLVDKLGNMIRDIGSSYETMDETQRYTRFSEIYQKTVGTMGRRIQVIGLQELLEQPAVADKVRALLLCGIRFAWLWRQLGGRRWHLLIYRSRIRNTLKHLHHMGTIH